MRLIQRDVMLLSRDVDIDIAGVEECVASAMGVIAEVSDQRAAIPPLCLAGTVAQLNILRLPA